MKREKNGSQFVICVRNDDCEDLQVGKVYQVVSDKKADDAGYTRVVDDSSEDYLYPENFFVAIKLPLVVEKALLAA